MEVPKADKSMSLCTDYQGFATITAHITRSVKI